MERGAQHGSARKDTVWRQAALSLSATDTVFQRMTRTLSRRGASASRRFSAPPASLRELPLSPVKNSRVASELHASVRAHGLVASTLPRVVSEAQPSTALSRPDDKPTAHGVRDLKLASVAVPGADKDPVILVEYCTNWLPSDLARLPELDLGEGLSRPMHCYAHGGFMGAAISMLADPEWENILLDSVAETSTLKVASQVGKSVMQAGCPLS